MTKTEKEERWKIVFDRAKLRAFRAQLREKDPAKADLFDLFYQQYMLTKSYSVEGLKLLPDFWTCLCVKHGLTEMARTEELEIRITTTDVGTIRFARKFVIGSVRKFRSK